VQVDDDVSPQLASLRGDLGLPESTLPVMPAISGHRGGSRGSTPAIHDKAGGHDPRASATDEEDEGPTEGGHVRGRANMRVLTVAIQ
jgi:hypothetical protein